MVNGANSLCPQAQQQGDKQTETAKQPTPAANPHSGFSFYKQKIGESQPTKADAIQSLPSTLPPQTRPTESHPGAPPAAVQAAGEDLVSAAALPADADSIVASDAPDDMLKSSGNGTAATPNPADSACTAEGAPDEPAPPPDEAAIAKVSYGQHLYCICKCDSVKARWIGQSRAVWLSNIGEVVQKDGQDSSRKQNNFR